MASWRLGGVLGRGLIALGLAVSLVASARSTLSVEAGARGAVALIPRERPGPALRAAIEALEDPRSGEADRLLSGIAARHPIIADDAALLQARLRLDSGRYGEVIRSAARWERADPTLRNRFLSLLGKAHVATGEEERARIVWDSAARTTASSEERAVLRIATAESHERSGDPEGAVAPYLEVWIRYPTTGSAEAAARGLDGLERELGRTLRGGSDFRKRGDSLYRQRHNEDALAAYEHALGLQLSTGERRKVEAARARALFRLRRYTEAAHAYGKLPASSERRIQRGRALARSGQIAQGIREIEDVAAGGSAAAAAGALLLAGLLHEGEGDFDTARERFRATIKRAPTSGSARAARWRLGWRAYRAGHFDEAIGHFEVLTEEELDPVAALRPRYWRSRILEQRDGEVASADAYAEIAREFPLSYYGWRASQRLDGPGAPRVVEVIAPGSAEIGPADTALPQILLEAGLTERAREELEPLVGRARGLADRLSLAQLYADAGDFHHPQRLVVDAYMEQLAKGPSPTQLELWWHAWPAPFEQEMQAAALAGASAPPELVYAVMREESGYRPRVISVAGARGLLQLMPLTAEKLAATAQLRPPAADDLFLPALNIRLGADYLSSLLARFGGRNSAVIGSYNAGPRSVADWLQEGAREDDAWVEEIPYNQTRGYVKRVLRSLHAYRVLY